MICNWLWLKTAIVVLMITSRNVTFFLISSLVSGVLYQLQNFWQLHLIEFLGLRYGTIRANVLDIYKAFDSLSVVCWSSSQTQILWNFRSDCWPYFTEIWGSKWLINFDFNARKVQLVLFDQSNNYGAINVIMNGSVLEEKYSFKMLELPFSFKLNWGFYIVSVDKTISKKIGDLIRSMKSVSSWIWNIWKGREKITKIWISQERKELFRWNKKYFS